jgi:maltokinase
MTATATLDPGLDPALVEALEPWLRAQRWFPVKGTDVTCTALGGIELSGIEPSGIEPDGVRVRCLLVTVEAASTGTRAVLQVPLVLEPTASSGGHVLAVHDGLAVRDGAGDPAFVAAWLAVADGPVADLTIDPAASRVLTGEQSNTSVVLSGPDDAGPVGVLKVLRSLTPGDNPDVDVPRRLADVGWDAVPRPLGWSCASWPGADAPGYLAALAQYIPDAEDGFELACDHARRGASFAALAGDLGTVVAGMHRALLTAYGPADESPADESPDHGAEDGGARLAAVLRERFAWAAGQVPSLSGQAEAVAARADALASRTGLPARQRVHGDLHLGQVLRSHGGNGHDDDQDRWYVLDFEGEPLAPVQVRTRPDLALRDVAGMLRSFDYAAAVGGLVGDAADAWVGACRRAFWDAYRAASADDLDACADVLAALELDKVLYEVVYESRNRPAWVTIPQHGLDRLLAG